MLLFYFIWRVFVSRSFSKCQNYVSGDSKKKVADLEFQIKIPNFVVRELHESSR